MNGGLECGLQMPKRKMQQKGQPGTRFKLNTVQGLNARDLAKEQGKSACVGGEMSFPLRSPGQIGSMLSYLCTDQLCFITACNISRLYYRKQKYSEN